MTGIAGNNEVVNSRQFDYPLERVFAAWTTPEQLARWWGPKGFTNTFHEFDLRPGGQWRFVMHGPDGKDYPNHSEFVEIVPHERIVIRHLNAPEFEATATFEQSDGKTTLIFRQVFKKPDVVEQARTFLLEANEQNFDRLNDLLAELSIK
ncbi:SRPBCC family protein [Paenibacillus pedocola]|uniref:SRPBCC family protein n=1 Tax=Paenibacillus pedocola TaxID=3242193 RepID=UPI0028775E7F|nr:SRPBCC family protein [Paenibacillus typhae]